MEEALNGCKGKLLDVGCSSGLFTLISIEKNLEVFGLDFSRAMVKKAKEKGVRVILADAYHLPVKENFFDVVLLFTTLEFLEENIVLNEIKRVLKSGGWLILGVHNRLNPWNLYRKIKAKLKKESAYKTIRYYSISNLKKTLRKNSFKLESVSTCILLPSPNTKTEFILGMLEKLSLKIGAIIVAKAKLEAKN